MLSTALAPCELYPLSLHAALPIWADAARAQRRGSVSDLRRHRARSHEQSRDLQRRESSAKPSKVGNGSATDRKSTRLNYSHTVKSYDVLCLKKKLNQLDHCHPALH